ncbi:DNA alkylation repair protein [Aureibacillus halotolerans]|uniref:3-methyladenine DNA glycosylase AlkC n=1 Tax=Aureibacillus halotolerans TaxID=1508390 RepID=A0A4R6TVF3_9BACI|nr:DNA alkylation repair protein [Aureibacillus halotolerans]TDQ37176.1 3-methyladenine DNA glycosylase AlkC [Aureibacillus halotolerans]
MADALKDVYSHDFLTGFAQTVASAYAPFDPDAFVTAILTDDWSDMALKQRMRRITMTLGEHLPDTYEDALHVLYSIDEKCTGFPYLFFPDFVEVHGQKDEHWESSMVALARFTQRSSAEFAVRPFLLQQPERMVAQMIDWASHQNEHVRRLASEGSRPRLPWGQALPMFKNDPSPVLPILETLKADPSLYVRKSVANHLNDIAKDNPEIVIQTARRWMGTSPETDWIVRHGCRTLIRKALPEVLQLFGYADASSDLISAADITITPDELSIGDECVLDYDITLQPGEPAYVRIEYGIDFVKARGTTSRKLFLLSDKTVDGGARLTGKRTHRWADLTTRKHYPGDHRVSLLINGVEVADTVVHITEKTSN